MAENRSRAFRLAAAAEFHARCVLERERDRKLPDGPKHFVLTALQEATAELAPLLGVSEVSVEIQIDQCNRLMSAFPAVWQMCLDGRLDIGKAQLLLDAASSLADESDIPEFARLMNEYFARHDDPTQPLVTLTRQQIQSAARYRKLRFKQRSDEERFLDAFKKRRVSFHADENGMGHLSVNHMVTEAMAADYRLTLIAKRLCQGDESRTLEQMRADVMIDLILGRLTVSGTNGQLDESHDGGDESQDDCGRDGDSIFERHATGRFARPVIHVTVPIQTLMGLSDEPGLLSGNNAIPADLARLIAQDPDSTWYRMLTDEARSCVELSTHSYKPTNPVWRQVIARDQTCIYPGCCRPAVRTDLDHRVPYPRGETSTNNLESLCRRHHRVKHANGFALERHLDGSYTLTTRAGSAFRTRPPEQPVADWSGYGDGRSAAHDQARATDTRENLVLTA